MQFTVLGPVGMATEDGQAVPLSGRLRTGLLALLLARANDHVPVEVLLDALWNGQREPTRRRPLQLHIHWIRKALDSPDRLRHARDGYQLAVQPGELDAERFESLLDESIREGNHDPGRTADRLRCALRLWRGRPYQDVDLPELEPAAQRLIERKATATELLYEAELRGGRHAAVLPELLDAVAEYPLRERLRASLMIALYRAGRQADALTAYQDARRRLTTELGLDPGPELQDLQLQILAGEPVDLGRDVARVSARPAQLPRDVTSFVGRAAELTALDHTAAAGELSPGLVTVTGTAGVGKTALVVHWAHHNRTRFPDGQLYVDLHGYGPEPPLRAEEALVRMLRALGVAESELPDGLAERTDLFRTVASGKRMLLVLDNAHSVEQVRPLLPGTSCLVVVTSRNVLAGLAARDGGLRIALDRLRDDEAHSLLKELLGEYDRIRPEASTELIDRCARLPLALRIATERVRLHPHRDTADLMAELADEQTRLDLLDTGDPATSVRAVLSWSYHHLDPGAARLFRLLGLTCMQCRYPRHDFDGYSAAALLGDDDTRESRRLLDSLVRTNLCEETASGRFQLHELLRAYSTELTADPEELDAARLRLCEYLLANATRALAVLAPGEIAEPPEITATPQVPVSADRDAARRWLDRERQNVLCVAHHIIVHGHWPDARGVATALYRHFTGDSGEHLLSGEPEVSHPR
ncbi:BTAD domain-containing putative transcriptional regulator [Haloechinothrix sp. LS1_15]|uniref:AfsR/SARP family transcriptional regulator n=1 Tax=Haloechinothrix sp. LS1_15 TaxID=2652248 RepID=UPI002947BE43|nr:BTAD domain-containing putative transcriptional regulator [Haloechinothrix sp. LS1_15]MDV6011410.1 hypothetical protein [Haloechinothrix sp. LS1_15]